MTETRHAPVIGITPCTPLGDYIESVRRAGGEPLLLRNSDDPVEVLRRIDGVLLTGGADVDPELYGQPAHPSTEVEPARDRFELPLTRAALAENMPLLAICRGVQVLNVAGGGTLVQDLPTESPSELEHAIDVPNDHVAHTVRVAPGTRLAVALGRAAAIEACPVNSRHHQAVDRVAPQFIVSASSSDGIVEGIEQPAAPFCVGVQWHPENFWRTGEFDGLFSEFVAAARRTIGVRSGNGSNRRSGLETDAAGPDPV
ncbi:MAG: gamma-glutamyl-gamma-aminobutyrate hydrolase family protein [Vicinamibacterales bacterium]